MNTDNFGHSHAEIWMQNTYEADTFELYRKINPFRGLDKLFLRGVETVRKLWEPIGKKTMSGSSLFSSTWSLRRRRVS
jgi:hypothetical protein